MKYIIFVLLIFFVTTPTLKADVKKWQLEQVGFLNIDRNEKDYGGFSGLVISNEATEALVVTDKSFFFVLELRRDENENLIGYSVIRKGRILSSKGKHLNGRNTDSESIVIDKNNNYYISFESNHRIMMHAKVEGKGVFIPKHPMFRKLSVNKGIEALAIDNEDRLIAIPEKPPLSISDIPIFRLQNNEWDIIKYVKIKDNFLITDADFLPQGLLLVLERKFSWTQGFKTRFRLISLDNFDNKKTITVRFFIIKII